MTDKEITLNAGPTSTDDDSGQGQPAAAATAGEHKQRAQGANGCEGDEQQCSLPGEQSDGEAGSHDGVVRIGLRDPLPTDLQPGTVVEIDLIGTGHARTYTLLAAYPCFGDGDHLFHAVDVLERCAAELQRAIESRWDASSVSVWDGIMRRLCLVEDLVTSPVAERAARPSDPTALLNLIVLVEKTLLSCLSSDADELHDRLPIVSQTLDRALQWCRDLAAEVEETLQRSREQASTVEYGPINQQSMVFNETDSLAAGLRRAMGLGLDVNSLELGSCCFGNVPMALRGSLL